MYTVDVEYELVNPELQRLEKMNLTHTYRNRHQCFKTIDYYVERYGKLLVNYEIIREYENETA